MVTDQEVEAAMQKQQDVQRDKVRSQLEAKQRAEAEKAAQALERANTLAMLERERTELPQRIRAQIAERATHIAKLAKALAPIIDATHRIEDELREIDRLKDVARLYGEGFDRPSIDLTAVDIAPTDEYSLYAVGIARAISAGNIGWVMDKHRRYFFSHESPINVTLDNP